MATSSDNPATENILSNALAAARRGHIAEGLKVILEALAEDHDHKALNHVALNALAGLFALRLGDLNTAVWHLDKAHRSAPEDVTIASNLIEALVAADRLEDALERASAEFAARDKSWRLARLRAFILQSVERFEEAGALYQQVLVALPNDFDSWNNLGNAAAGYGDHEASIAALRRAIALRPDVAPARINLATSLTALSRFDDAVDVLRQAIVDFPGDAKPVMELAATLKLVGRDGETLSLLNEACRREPDKRDLWVALAVECFLAWDAEATEAALQRALALAPDDAEANVLLAVLMEHTGRAAQLDGLVESWVEIGPSEGVVNFVRALICNRDRRFSDGLAVLARVPDDIEPVRSAQLSGQFYDRLGNADAAFASFTEMNRLLSLDPTDPMARAARYRADQEADRKLMTAAWYQSWHSLAAPTEPPPCFLVGFPRSGTTLLDTMLMGHANACVAEERPGLRVVESAVTDGLAGLATLASAQADELRAIYYQEMARWVNLDANKLLVDKFPLHLAKVPLAHRLFPSAKFILALRHPCDVVLSCFNTNFRLNNAMASFLSIETAAQFYDQTFAFWVKARSIMPIKVHTVVYEDIITDPGRHMRGVIEYLGLDWQDNVLDHERTAAGRGVIPTASYAQVTQPLYKRAAGRWLRYRKHLEPVLPILAPWVERFGYSLDG